MTVTMPETETDTQHDPLHHVRPGDPVDEHTDETRGDGTFCRATGGSGTCTRDPGHPGQHIAGMGSTVVMSVWVDGERALTRGFTPEQNEAHTAAQVAAGHVIDLTPAATPAVMMTLAPDLIDNDGDLNVVIGIGSDGEPRYGLTHLSIEIPEAGDTTRDIDTLGDAEVERARQDKIAELERDLDDYKTRERIEDSWGVRSERPRTVPLPAELEQVAQATVTEAAQTQLTHTLALHARLRAETDPALESDLESEHHVWVYTGTRNGQRRFRHINKIDGEPPSGEQIEQVRREYSPDNDPQLASSDSEAYIRGRHGASLRERPRDLGDAVDAYVAEQEGPAPAPVSPDDVPADPLADVRPGGFAVEAFDRNRRCQHLRRMQYSRWECSRTPGHPGHHIHAESGQGFVNAVWITDGPGLERGHLTPAEDEYDAAMAAKGYPIKTYEVPVMPELPDELPEDAPAEERIARLQERQKIAEDYLAAFKAATRRQVIDGRRRGSWCEGGTSEVLRHLDLPLLKQERIVTLRVEVRIPDAASDDSAMTKAKNLVQRATAALPGEGASVREIRADRHDVRRGAYTE